MKKQIIALLAVLALVAAACGGDDSDSEATTTTTVAATTTTTVVEEMMDETVVDVAVNNGFETLVTAVQAAGLVDTLSGDGPFTVFAPTDEAFAALPPGMLEGVLADTDALTAILTYHVVPGKVLAADVVGLSSATSVQGDDIAIEVVDGGVVLNGTTNVTATDVEASNGVVHVIDSVLLPPSLSSPAAEEPMLPGLIETAEAAGTFNTLLAALDAAGLREALNSGALGKLTIFAPTDEAFEALPEGTLDGLLADTTALTGVLTYHVVTGEVLAADVVGLDAATTLANADISIAVVDGGVVLNDSANVVTTDIMTSGGIIHVIDAVLIPPSS
ncbi:MAG: fasciclin domain-containing protein [Acidimicrobiia bacterium]|nr:fasciclin domain-containing protein [Acidimicrobiia bacterium]